MVNSYLKQHFGFDAFREGQEAVVTAVMQGRSAAAIFPTGSGKSLCYQLPAVMLPHLTLVISPLLALMQDQIRFLKEKGIEAATIDSSMSREEVNHVMRDVQVGKTKILMVAVERLKNERFRHFIKQVPISLLVVDEAHCISEWGHNFRPDYLKLPHYKHEFSIPQVLLLTATATPEVIQDMANKFSIAASDITVTGFYRKNLNLAVESVSEKNKLIMLENWLFHEARFKPIYQGDVRQKKDRSAEIESTIVYVTLQKTAEDVAHELKKLGFNAKAYHAGMDSEDRQITQTDFMAGNIDIIVATIAFGMGIDKSNIRHVVHYDLPKSIENYSQEVGRAGRDGMPSDCLVLANKDNLNVLENFVYGDTPEYESIEAVLNTINMQQQDGKWEWQLYNLSNETNTRQLPLKTLLVYLEMKQIVQPMYAYFAEYKFKLLVSEQELVGRFEGERQSFVQAILHYSKPAKIWWTADIDAICQHYSSGDIQHDRQRVLTALEYFQQQNLIELQTKQMTEVYRVLQPQIDVGQLTGELTSYFQQKEQSEIKRIHNMLDMFEREQCLSFQLASYFGDAHAPVHCGHCSVCLGHKVSYGEVPPLADLSKEQLMNDCSDFINTYQQTMAMEPSKVLLTRFLLGLTVPIFTKLKSRKDKHFGKLEHYRYQQVLTTLLS